MPEKNIFCKIPARALENRVVNETINILFLMNIFLITNIKNI